MKLEGIMDYVLIGASAFSGLIGFFYALYQFAILGSDHEFECVTNLSDFHPYAYQNSTELDEYVSHPGSYNVTHQFNTIILYGFISNLIAVAYFVFRLLTP